MTDLAKLRKTTMATILVAGMCLFTPESQAGVTDHQPGRIGTAKRLRQATGQGSRRAVE